MTGVIQERMKRLQESTVSDNVVLSVLASIGLSNHGILWEKKTTTTKQKRKG